MGEEEDDVEAIKAASLQTDSEILHHYCIAPELPPKDSGGVNAFNAYTYQCLIHYANP